MSEPEVHAPEWEMARSLRAAKRNNAQDSLVTAFQQRYGFNFESASDLARCAVTDLAAWFRTKASATLNGDPFILASEWAASALEEFSPMPEKPSSDHA